MQQQMANSFTLITDKMQQLEQRLIKTDSDYQNHTFNV